MRKVIIAVLACIMLCAGMSGCSVTSFVYDDADKYTMGEATLNSEVKDIDIEWISGRVNIEYHSDSTVRFSESSKSKLDDDNTMYYWLDGTTLKIKFSKSGKFDFKDLNKTLSLYLPEEFEFGEVKIETVSANIEVNDLYAKEARFETVSGSIFTSHIYLNGELRLESVSGKINASASKVGSLRAYTVSGDMSIRPGRPPEAAKIESVSGDIELYVGEGTGMTVEIDTVSGTFNSELELKKEGKKYVSGDGAFKCDIETTSGDIDIKTK